MLPELVSASATTRCSSQLFGVRRLSSVEAARAEWRLLCACHNLRKLFVVRGTVRKARLAPA
jgi:hypothetical protein